MAPGEEEGLEAKTKNKCLRGFGKSIDFAWAVSQSQVEKQWKTDENRSKTTGLYENVWFCYGFHRFVVDFRYKIYTLLKQNLYFCNICFAFASRPSSSTGAISLSSLSLRLLSFYLEVDSLSGTDNLLAEAGNSISLGSGVEHPFQSPCI